PRARRRGDLPDHARRLRRRTGGDRPDRRPRLQFGKRRRGDRDRRRHLRGPETRRSRNLPGRIPPGRDGAVQGGALRTKRRIGHLMSAHDVKLFGDQIAASRLETRFARLKAPSLLRLAIEDLYPGRIALVSSFGADAAALLHIVAGVDKTTPVIFVNTGQHFPETLRYRDELCALLGLTNVISAKPEPEVLAKEDPENWLFASDPDRCCDIRKVRPLAAAMEGYDAWITGRKGFETAERAKLPLFEAEGERVKVNPLVGWTAADVRDYIRSAGLPR